MGRSGEVRSAVEDLWGGRSLDSEYLDVGFLSAQGLSTLDLSALDFSAVKDLSTVDLSVEADLFRFQRGIVPKQLHTTNFESRMPSQQAAATDPGAGSTGAYGQESENDKKQATPKGWLPNLNQE